MSTKIDYKKELLPCPFCGAPAEILYDWNWGKYGGGDHSIGCSNINCEIQPGLEAHSPDEGAKIWNHRTLVNPHLSRFEIIK